MKRRTKLGGKAFAIKSCVVATHLALAAAFAPTLASAQQAQRVEKIEVTGSSIRRVEGETALPVTVIRAEELQAAGITTIEQVLTRIPASQSLLGVSQGIGASTGGQAEANLRGLGGNKTLVLLNGRRIANHAYYEDSADLNSIPLAAIDRIEILRDGASAIYGTDAVGGVINFILKKDFTGVEISGDLMRPDKSGGREYRYSGVLGYGSLDKDRFNVMAVADYHKMHVLRSTDRDFGSTGINFARGLFLFSGTTFPANYTGFNRSGGTFTTSPNFPGCRPAVGSVNLTPDVPGNVCRFDFTREIDLIPDTEQKSFYTRGTFAVTRNTTASLEYVWAENTTINRVAATPVTGLSMPTTNRYFPGAGITPAPAASFDFDPTQPVFVNWRMLPAGKRTSVPEAEGSRLVGELNTVWNRWDLRAGAFWSESKVNEDFTDGYIRRPLVIAGINCSLPGFAGVCFNPFNDPTAAEVPAIQSTRMIGQVIAAKNEVTGLDVRGSTDLMQMGGGAMALALGAEARRQKFHFDLIEENAREAASSGLELTTDTRGDRKVHAVFGELLVPFARGWEAQFAVRHDHYSDVGNTTNPKVAIRFQPTSAILMRASANTGFRAPTLYELHQPEQFTFSAAAYDDPVLCPGGVPRAGAVEGRDCGQQVIVRLAGNTNLEPEKSRTYAIGAVWEPIRGGSVSLDFWQINLRNSVAVLGEQSIDQDPVKYADRILRCSQVSAALRAVLDRCQIPGGDPIAYFDTPNQNLGEVKTSGIDVSAQYRFPAARWGQFNLSFEGTYVTKYDYQRERGGEFVENVGRFVDAGPIFRWQHVASIGWRSGPWTATLTNRYKSGYEDQNFVDDEFLNRVTSYSLWDVSAGWSGMRGLNVMVGVKNIADKEPPFSNQGNTFQAAYDPRFADPIGRAIYARVSYRFR